MSDACYMAQALICNKFIKYMSKIKLTNNVTGQYDHDNILIAINQITKIFTLLYNQSVSGLGMAMILDNTDNALTNKKSTDIFTIEYVLQ